MAEWLKIYKVIVVTAVIAFVAAVSLPAFNIFIAEPMMLDYVARSAEHEAVKVASHVGRMLVGDGSQLDKLDYGPDFMQKARGLMQDFNIRELKLLTPDGRVVFTSEENPVESDHREKYFYDRVAQGMVYTNVILRDDESEEFRHIDGDVIETIVPFMKDGVFIGACEIYYDISVKTSEFYALVRKFYFLLIILPALLFCVFMFSLLRLNRAIRERDEVARRLVMLNVELESATKRANEANSAKSRFLTNVSHEMRTPLGGIIGLSELMLKSPGEKPSSEDIMMINSSARSLLGVINDLLDLSAVEAGKFMLRPEPFVLRDFISSTVGIYRFSARQKGLDLTVNLPNDLPDVVVGDSGRLRQVLVNLMGNAIKYTHSGSVMLDVELIEGGQDYARIGFTVSDTGIGIEPGKVESIFDPFVQLNDPGSPSVQGTGIGLTIARTIVQKMGGTITVESRPGRGSSFSFDIMLEVETEAFAVSEEPETAPMRRFDVLVAEDNFVNRKVICRILERAGHTVLTVENGAEALDALAGAEFDIVLMDVSMPVMDGLEATRRIRQSASPKVRSMPVIAVTANAMKGDEDNCLDAGMNDYITKPIKSSELLEKIARLVDARTKDGLRA